MSLDTVDAKLKNKEYQTLKEVVTDIGQIFNNAKRCELFRSGVHIMGLYAEEAETADNLKTSLLFIYAKKLHVRSRDLFDP